MEKLVDELITFAPLIKVWLWVEVVGNILGIVILGTLALGFLAMFIALGVALLRVLRDPFWRG